MSAAPLSPLNDNAFLVTLYDVQSPSGHVVPLTTGSVSGFLATSNSPTATAADASLTATVTYTGAGGRWLVTYDAAALTASLLNTHFASATPYTILQLAGSFRVAVAMEYSASRAATVES